MKKFCLMGLAALAACSSEREAALAVTVTLEAGTTSSHVVVTVKGDDTVLTTGCMAVSGQRVLDVAVAQGALPATVTLWADGFSDDACATPTEPIENSVVIERRFRKGLILDAPLVLRQVRPSIETSCANGLDDDNDGHRDCDDLDCTARACSTGNVCIEAQVCLDGVCQGGQRITCTTPPSSCFTATNATCVVDAGCQYRPATGDACDAGSECVTNARCDAMGACVGQVRTCSTPPAGQCWASAGACVAGSGCVYEPAIDAGCDDHDNCTLDDRCGGDAGCEGTPVSCPPQECAFASGSCTDAGACVYTPRDAGIACGAGGACNTQGGCLPPFPFVPSNVAINDIPTPPSGKTTYGCGTTIIDSSGAAPTFTNECAGQPKPGWAHITQSGGLSTLVLAYEDLDIAGGSTLQLIGTRPVIIVSMSDVRVLGTILVGAGAQACPGGGAGAPGSGLVFKSGAGGGGFASAGAAGGSVLAGASGGSGGAVNMGTQLRGGCPGGVGGGVTTRAAAGGGALQLVALNTISIVGIVTAPGEGGTGNGYSNGGNGGGSGGQLLLEAQQVVGTGGALTCNGGGGGQGGTMNDGQKGQATALAAQGGRDAVSGGIGGAGAADTSASTAGETAGFGGGGGGGGGGVGRININVTNGCNIGPQVVISPPAVSNKPDAGCP